MGHIPHSHPRRQEHRRQDAKPKDRSRNQEPGARSQEPGARRQEPGARRQESGARSKEPGDGRRLGDID